eukprot:2360300-Rhodomonas_salina.1
MVTLPPERAAAARSNAKAALLVHFALRLRHLHLIWRWKWGVPGWGLGKEGSPLLLVAAYARSVPDTA